MCTTLQSKHVFLEQLLFDLTETFNKHCQPTPVS